MAFWAKAGDNDSLFNYPISQLTDASTEELIARRVLQIQERQNILYRSSSLQAITPFDGPILRIKSLSPPQPSQEPHHTVVGFGPVSIVIMAVPLPPAGNRDADNMVLLG